MVVQFVLLIVGAYLLGSVPAAYLAVRWSRGTDIRTVGSGNVGAANVLSAGPRWLAVPVAVFDIGKGALTVWAAQQLGLSAIQQVTVGLCTIIGHNWPVFLRFRGGRGVFASLGVITMLSPWLGLIIVVLAYSLAPFRQVALGVLIAYICLPFISWFLYAPLGIDERLPIMLGMVSISLIGLFKRLTAPRTELSRSVPLGELVLNRILFDRDIRDRKAWINQETIRPDSAEDLIDRQD
jgi:glycerol-3-phosphate acyltransferase PlsY